MISQIDLDEALTLPHPLFVDVRSESEFMEDHIPGAINLPVFNDKERELVGTTYKKEGPEEARILGLKILSPKLPDLVETVQTKGEDKHVILYCSRGGMRSKSLSVVLDLMNTHLYRINGGYKQFRREVYSFFYQIPFLSEIVVLHGLTGTGKTEVIKMLIEKGAGVVDLEGLANHRGSVFGSVGLPPQPTQKYFESLLWEQCRKHKDKKYLVVECESKRIGKVVLPALFFNAMKEGRHLLLYDNMDNRINRIIADYDIKRYGKELTETLWCLKDRLGVHKIGEYTQRLKNKEYFPVLEELLTGYYDRLYKYPDRPADGFDLCVSTADSENAAMEIMSYLKNKYLR